MEKYSKKTIAIHWISVALIALMIITGKFWKDIDGNSYSLLIVHFIIGMLVALLTIWRVVIHFKGNRPAPLKTNSDLRNKIIIWVQYIFYLVIFILALSGMLMLLKGGYLQVVLDGDMNFTLDEENCHGLHIHEAMVKVFFVLLFAHIAGVFSYIYQYKHNIFKRIF